VSGDEAAAAGPLTVWVPEKVQCPLSKARCIGIKRVRQYPRSRFVLELSLSVLDTARREERILLYVCEMKFAEDR